MSDKRFRARAKKVQKLGRDGLVEQNKATGEEKRISQRTADISFGPDRTKDQEAGHRVIQRGGGDSAVPSGIPSGKKRRKQPRPVQQTAEEAVWASSSPEPDNIFSTPEAPDTVETAAPFMRMAADAPMMDTAVITEEAPPPPDSSRRRKRKNRKNRKKVKQRQAAKHTPHAAR